MKKKVVLLFSFLLVLLLVACGKERTAYYTVSFNSNGAEEFQSRAIADNDLIVEPRVPTRVGYTFLGWFNGDVKWNFETDRVHESMTLTANWKRIKYVVKFDSNGGSPIDEQVVESGNLSIKPTDPTKENCRFLGWFIGEDEWLFDINLVTDYITLTAKWEDYPTHTVEFNSDGGTKISSQYVIDGNRATLPFPPTKQNSKFLGWYDGDVLWNFNANTVNGNIVLTARWEDCPTHTVTFDSSGGTSVQTQYVPVGSTALKPPTPEKSAMVNFIGWYLGGTEWDFSTPVTSDMTLYARWQNMHKIIFVIDGQVIESFYIEEGSTVPKLPDPTKEGYLFAGWYNGDKKWNFETDRSNSGLTLTAKWEPIPTHAVTFDTVGGSEINPQYIPDKSFVIDPGKPTKQGFRFDGWTLNGKAWDFNSNKVTGPITLVAKWVEIAELRFNSAGGSYVESQITDKGRPATKPTDPTREGYLFDGWVDPDGIVWDFAKMNVTENTVLTAKWLKAYTIYFDADGGTVTPDSVIVGEGKLITEPEAYRSEKFILDGWYIDGTDTRWNFSTMTVNNNIYLKARWSIILPPVSVGQNK